MNTQDIYRTNSINSVVWLQVMIIVDQNQQLEVGYEYNEACRIAVFVVVVIEPQSCTQST